MKCTIISQKAKNLFNQYSAWFRSLDPTDENLDLTLTIRVRAFGSEQVKQATWKKDWADKNGWGKAAYGVNVSSNPPELWMDLRMCKAGLVLPLEVLAHELMHSIHNADGRVVDPDNLIEEVY